jgi:hypothetical protein
MGPMFVDICSKRGMSNGRRSDLDLMTDLVGVCDYHSKLAACLPLICMALHNETKILIIRFNYTYSEPSASVMRYNVAMVISFQDLLAPGFGPDVGSSASTGPSHAPVNIRFRPVFAKI